MAAVGALLRGLIDGFLFVARASSSCILVSRLPAAELLRRVVLGALHLRQHVVHVDRVGGQRHVFVAQQAVPPDLVLVRREVEGALLSDVRARLADLGAALAFYKRFNQVSLAIREVTYWQRFRPYL